MANPSTTHVIEIETGIGEPAFIPFASGEQVEPLSLGKKGMWRIESTGVLDVHAFVYFDGAVLFLQSADESTPARVDGYDVGTTWTELRAPCQIELGSARLRFRSLLEEPEDAATAAVVRPPVAAPPVVAGPPDESSSQDPPRPAAGAPPTGAANTTPVTFPKADRPFRPGEFSSGPSNDEATRIGPVEAAGARSRLDHTPVHTIGHPKQASQAPTYLSAPGGTMPLGTRLPPSAVPGMYPSGGLPSRGYGPPDEAPAEPAPGAAVSYAAKYKALSWPKRLLVGLAPFYVLAAVYLLLFDDGAPTTPARAVAPDAGAKHASTTSSGATAPPSVAPSHQPALPDATAPLPGPTPSTPSSSVASTPPPPVVANAKTLERQAVDQVALGNYTAAAALYEHLQQQNPNNRVYAEAARILRAKADAGAP